MTKGEFLEKIKDLPDDCKIEIVDLRDQTTPGFVLKTDVFDYDNYLEKIVFEINGMDVNI